jgi:hypothetical protein
MTMGFRASNAIILLLVATSMNYVTVNVSNSNGSISRVRLRRDGIGYVGTRGEFYDHLPTQDGPRPIYGF